MSFVDRHAQAEQIQQIASLQPQRIGQMFVDRR
jgi:hypothetical protein